MQMTIGEDVGKGTKAKEKEIKDRWNQVKAEE